MRTLLTGRNGDAADSGYLGHERAQRNGTVWEKRENQALRQLPGRVGFLPFT